MVFNVCSLSVHALYFVAATVLVSLVWSCPEVCICTDDSATCYIESCADHLPVSFDTLTVYGTICSDQRRYLDAEYEGYLELKDDTCQALRRC